PRLRSAAFTAEPVAKRSEGRPTTAADVRSGNTIETPTPDTRVKGSQTAREAGAESTRESRNSAAAAEMTPPGIRIGRCPIRPASLPNGGASRKTTSGPGAIASPVQTGE